MNPDKKLQKKTVYILRGVSGAGKSTLAGELVPDSPHCIFSADDFFVIDGVCRFDAKKLQQAHRECFTRFCDYVDSDIGPLVVANTNITEKEFKHYIDYATEGGYTVFSIIVENRHGGNNVHNVSEGTLNKQAARFQVKLK